MTFVPNKILQEIKNYCYEADFYSMEELTYLDEYIRAYLNSIEFVNGKRKMILNKIDNLNSIQEMQVYQILDEQTEKISNLMNEGFYDLTNKGLNQSVDNFLTDDNGFSTNDFENFKSGLFVHIKSDIYVLFSYIERVIDNKVDEYHETR